MGMDGIDIVLRCESDFGIDIPDADVRVITTPAALSDYIADRVAAVPPATCTSQRVFNRIRQGLRTQVPALFPDIRLDTVIGDAIHKDQWPRLWKAIRDAVGDPSWPETIPWPTLLRAGPKTVRDLVWQVAIAVAVAGRVPQRPWTKDEVGLHVRLIIHEEAGLGLGFDAQATFSKLGMN